MPTPYRLQFFVTLAVMAAILLLASDRWQRINFIRSYAPVLLALLLAVPLIGYLVIRPFIVDLYRDEVGIGLGWWVTLVATIALLGLSGGTDS